MKSILKNLDEWSDLVVNGVDRPDGKFDACDTVIVNASRITDEYLTGKRQ